MNTHQLISILWPEYEGHIDYNKLILIIVFIFWVGMQGYKYNFQITNSYVIELYEYINLIIVI